MNRRSFVAGATAAVAALGMGAVSALAEEGASSAADEGAAAGGEYDIVVVGMGGAGMCSALAAKEAGVEKVIILEKNAMEGGNTIFSSSGMNASDSTYEKEQVSTTPPTCSSRRLLPAATTGMTSTWSPRCARAPAPPSTGWLSTDWCSTT